MSEKKWSDEQVEYMAFLSRGMKLEDGTKITGEKYAQVKGVSVPTQWRWRQLPGFRQGVFELAVSEHVHRIPDLVMSQLAKATGQDMYSKDDKGNRVKVKPGDTQAFMAIMRQFELLKSEKIDHTTGGEKMPAPIFGGTSATSD